MNLPESSTKSSTKSTTKSDSLQHPSPTLSISSPSTHLHVDIYKKYVTSEDTLFQTILSKTTWYRVKYESARYKNQCETPCYTNFYGGVTSTSPVTPYQPVPDYLAPLVAEVSSLLNTPFNAILLRLYFDGSDNIAWHTDGRKFLGPTPTIASLSFGGGADFQLRKMTDCWPCVSTSAPNSTGVRDDGVDRSEPERSLPVASGDLLVMHSDMQDHWHHRVPSVRSRLPRVNINFRYILPTSGDVGVKGQETYYKYMVYGDHKEEWRGG